MANIKISDLRPIQNEFSAASASHLSELTQEETNITKGGLMTGPSHLGLRVGLAIYSYGKNKGWW